MGISACSCKPLRLKRAVGYALGAQLPGGVYCIKARQHCVRRFAATSCRLSTGPELQESYGSDIGRVLLQASVVAVVLAVPFAAPCNAWPGRKAPKEEPPVVVVEDEPVFIHQAKELAKQAEERATQVLQTARATSSSVIEYVKDTAVLAENRAQDLKQQLVTTYGNLAALEKTEVQAAGAVVSLVVIVLLIKAISSLFSSSSPAKDSAPSSSREDSAVPPTSPPVDAPPAMTTVPAVVEPPAAAVEKVVQPAIVAAEETPAPLDVEIAAAIAAQIQDLFQADPNRFALMAEWLQSPAANKIRPQLVEEMSRLAALATSSQEEDEAPAPAIQAATSALSLNASPSSNGVVSVKKKKKISRQVDAQQLVTLVEWLRSPGAEPVRDKLGADVADQVAIWASKRVGLPINVPASTAAAAAPPPADEAPTPPAEALAPLAEQAPTATMAEDSLPAPSSSSASESGPPAAAAAESPVAAASSVAPRLVEETVSAPVPELLVAPANSASPAKAVPPPKPHSLSKALSPSKPASQRDSLGEVIKKKGPASPVLIALGLGSLALDIAFGKPLPKKSTKVETSKPASVTASKKPEAEPKMELCKKAPAVQEKLAPAMPSATAMKLEAVTFSFDEGGSNKSS